MLAAISIHVKGQQATACYSGEIKGFIKDGQDYILKLEDSKTGKVFLSFFEGFQYRVVICSSNTKKFGIVLYDINKKPLYSGLCENYIKNIDLKFNSNIACIAEIHVEKLTETKPLFTIAIGFKEN